MASPYLPLPPDSDNEDNRVPMSEDEEPESPSGYPYVPVRTDSETDEEEEDPEEDPEEDTEENSWEENNTNTVPSSSAPRQTARMRVATPERVTLSPDHVISTPDRHQMNMESFFSWELTLKTLRRWRDIGLGRSNYEQGETSEQREPLLDTTPIIVDRMLSHENRMDLIEDVIKDHLTSAGKEIIGLKEEVRKLTAKLEATNMTVRNLENTSDELVRHSHLQLLREQILYGSEKHAMEKELKKDKN